ncbi:glutamate racemase [Arenibacter nanhaiticus]|uniref:Glutamate racemase n=1 Tax=Arenibacter nanhaiticus TaxID=558155 RepID=A0A1M6HG28_9FLAO|nr:glutamate racemase [Arenibacter nanhaiticus]SHJ21059.1 glutamate racemase [Arenibacter nanhaiticus]
MSDRPIGIFDSGIGGTSIWREINRLLPKESTIYLADSKNAPYGEKTQAQILELSIKNVEFLINKGCKIIVVACNTATTNAIKELRASYTIPLIGIEPAIKPAALHTKSKTVGVLATKGTLSSALFNSTSELHANGIKVLEQEGTGLVALIEEGKLYSDQTKELLQRYLKPMLKEGIDQLVLGCTHYPYLIPLLKDILADEVEIIDSGDGVARRTLAVLEQHQLKVGASKTTVEHQFYTNVNPEVLKTFLSDVNGCYRVDYLDF